MKRSMPGTDSIEELAQFWQAHDLTDFDDELVEEETPVFRRQREETVGAALSPAERAAVRRIAASRGLEESALISEWVREKLSRTR